MIKPIQSPGEITRLGLGMTFQVLQDLASRALGLVNVNPARRQAMAAVIVLATAGLAIGASSRALAAPAAAHAVVSSQGHWVMFIIACLFRFLAYRCATAAPHGPSVSVICL